jgi:hypothetical protein
MLPLAFKPKLLMHAASLLGCASLVLNPCAMFRYHYSYLQARIAALLKDSPAAGQSFCRMLVAPFIHYMDSGKGAWLVSSATSDDKERTCMSRFTCKHHEDP